VRSYVGTHGGQNKQEPGAGLANKRGMEKSVPKQKQASGDPGFTTIRLEQRRKKRSACGGGKEGKRRGGGHTNEKAFVDVRFLKGGGNQKKKENKIGR